MSYAIGMRSKVCGTAPRSMDATLAPQKVSYKKLGVLSERSLPANRAYETCHWVIKFPESIEF